MKYAKPPLTVDQQVDLLLHRGMIGDRSQMMRQLTVVNYYRLSGYWHTFLQTDDTFKPGTTFELVWNTYAFDRQLRLLAMDALERIEVAVGSLLAHYHAHIHGAFAYADDAATLPGMDARKREAFLERVLEQTERSRETFARHFRNRYGDQHQFLPVWMAVEVMSFGTIMNFFSGASTEVKAQIASKFGIPHRVLGSWLLTLSTIRNICAHHGRLWNREIGTKPMIPRIERYPDWHKPVEVGNKRLFAALTICRYSLATVAPQSGWMNRLQALLDKYPTVPLENMGFPTNWKDCPIWQEKHSA